MHPNPTRPQPIARIPWIDMLRGIAILLMIPANLAVYWTAPHPMWFRLLTSYAAPTFLMLSTGMVILNANKYTFDYYLKRGLVVMGFGVFIDILIWQILPFTSYDILYLIGLSMPLIYVVREFSSRGLILLSLCFFIPAPFLQHIFGYHDEPLQILLSAPYWPGLPRIIQSLVLDGWFPLFPWLGFPLISAAFFKILFQQPQQILSKLILCGGIAFVVISLILLFLPTDLYPNLANHGIISERVDYSEIFYPPTWAFILNALGIFVIFTWLAQQIHGFALINILTVFGRYSMLVYILHQAIGNYIFLPILNSYHIGQMQSGLYFTLSVLATMFVLYILCRFIDYTKRFYRPKALVLQVLLGK